MKKRVYQTIWILLIVLGLSACAVQKAGNFGFKHGQGCADNWQQVRVNALNSFGFRIEQLGDKIFLIAPLDRLFPSEKSENLAASAHVKLKIISEFLSCYQTANVRIVVYNKAFRSIMKNKALSTVQAQAVMDYLYNHGLAHRMLYAVGKGIVNKKDQAGDQRVEIFVKIYS